MTVRRDHCPHNNALSCSDCRLSAICLPLSVSTDELARIDSIIKRGRPLQKGDQLFQAGGAFTALYAVRAGALKTTSLTKGGQEQITGFYLPGEIVGLDGVAERQHTNTACALETSAVCEIPFNQLSTLSLELPKLQQHIFQILGREISHEQQQLTLISKHTADERVAAFLLSWSARHERRQLSGRQLRLPMSRGELGNFLGLTIETVSRVISRMQKNGMLSVDKQTITIDDHRQLQQLADAS